MINRRVCIAPMMDYSDRHFRMLMRCMSKHTMLYSEMLVDHAIVYGDHAHLLQFSELEQPVAMQLGGSDPERLLAAAKYAQAYGYQEINLNVGCPSSRVQAGGIGVCLMKQPSLVASCVAKLSAELVIPVTVKTRIGVDDHDSYEFLTRFVREVTSAGCKTLIVHARKAWLEGLSPKENRHIPPLHYPVVYRLKQDFPDTEIIINGGIRTIAEIREHLRHVDGVMLGRVAYQNPYVIAAIDHEIYGAANIPSRHEIVRQYMRYVLKELMQGTPIRRLTRHLLGLFQGQPNAKRWRRLLSSQDIGSDTGIELLETTLAEIG